MSTGYNNDGCYFIDHSAYVNKLYSKVTVDGNVLEYNIRSNIFSIKSNNNSKTSRDRKRSRNHDEFLSETAKVKDTFFKFKEELPQNLKEDKLNKHGVLDTTEVREAARKLFENTNFDFKGLSGGNSSDLPLKCKLEDDYFLIPPKSRFCCGCVKEQCSKLEGTKFDILIADPPWWNKYIRRLKRANEKLSYSMMYNEDIASIPVRNLLSDNCLVAVWCTNAPSNISAVKDLIFPSWGIEYLATWYWMKVTVDLQPICGFSSELKKQPYERLMLGRVGNVKDIPDSKLIVSVPSALHSHKPPLNDILSTYLNKEDPQFLELFARYMLPNTTSVGYEPLKWQHISLYEEVKIQ